LKKYTCLRVGTNERGLIQSTKTSLFHLLSYVILSVQVLLAIKSLLKLSSTDVEDFEFYDLDSVLLRLGVQLEDLTPEDQKEFAVEVDALRREVQTLFQQKLKQAHS
jgi:hypothetical protein